MKHRLVELYHRIRQRLDVQSKVLIKNSSWVLAANVIIAVFAFAKSIVIVRGLGAFLYGNFAVMIAFVVTVQQLFNLKLGSTVIKYGAEYRKEGRLDKLVALIKTSVVLCTGLAVISTMVVAGLMTFAYDMFIEVPGFEDLLIIYSLTGGLIYFNSVSTGLLRLYYKFRITAIVRVLSAAFELVILTVVLWQFPGQLKPFIIAVIVVASLRSFALNGAALWELWDEIRPHLLGGIRLLREDRKPMAKFIFSVSGAGTLDKLRGQGDVLLLGALAGAEQVAFLAIAKKLAATLMRVIDPLRLTIYPQLASLIAQKSYAEVKGLVKRISLFFAVPGIMVLGILPFFATEILRSLYGAEFAAASSALYVYMIVTVIMAMLFWIPSLLNSMGMAHVHFAVSLSTLSVLVIAAWILVPMYGATGMALAVLIDLVINSFFLARYSWTEASVRSRRTAQQTHPAVPTNSI